MTKSGVKLADVAKAAGVSQGTASNVFSRPEVVREEVREHVKAVASQLGYMGPDLKGRLLRGGKVNAIGVAAVEPLSYFFDDPWARTLMEGISEACDANGAGISLVSAINDERLTWNIQSALVDGFVLLCVEGGERLVDLTRQRQLPFVALALGVDDKTIPVIGIDNYAAAKVAGRHIGELGHRRAVIIATPFADGHQGLVDPSEIKGAAYSTSRDRTNGYLDGLAEFGVDRASVPVFGTQNEEKTVVAALDALFSGPVRPTALFAMSDVIGLIALEWLQARGIRVPQDVSIIGFDGVPEAALSEPGLTTMAQPIIQLGRQAVEAILGQEPPSGRQTLPVDLVVRGSTGPAPL